MAINNVPPALGTTLLIGTQAEDPGTDTFEEVAEIVSIGEFGPETSVNTYSRLADGTVRKFKGPRDFGTYDIQLGRDPTDAGQAALKAAEADTSNTPYNVKVNLNDSLGSNSTSFDMKCLIVSYRTNIGDNSGYVGATVRVAVVEEPDETNAS